MQLLIQYMMPPSTPSISQPPDTSSSTIQSEQFERIWEGNLTAVLNGRIAILTKLKGYRCLTDPATLAEDWLSTMQIVRLLPADFFENKKCDVKVDDVYFYPLNQNTLLDKLHEIKEWALIELPSQVLLVSNPDKKDRMYGKLISKALLPLVAGPMISQDLSHHLVVNLVARESLQTETSDMNLNMTSVVQFSLPATGPGTSQPVLQSEEEEEEEDEFPQLWEGDLTAKLNGQTVIITKLKGYRNSFDPAKLAEDWPSTMLIDTLVPQSFFDKIPYDEKTNVVVFVPTNPQHILLEKMQKTKDLAVVRLPSQLLALMAPVEKENPMSGILFPKLRGDGRRYVEILARSGTSNFLARAKNMNRGGL